MENFLLFMTQKWYLFGALAALAFLFFRHESARSGATVSVHQLAMLVNRENALLVDIREPKEFAGGHLIDSINIPHNKIIERSGELEAHRERPLVLIDKMGQHSGHIGRQLQAAGYNVRRLDGGITEWKGSNLPLVQT